MMLTSDFGKVRVAGRVAESPATFAEVKAKLRQVGVTIKKTEFGEFRVNYVGGNEAGAYYTNSMDDAYHTGLSMAQHGDKF